MAPLTQRGASSRDIAYNEMQRVRALSHYWRKLGSVATSPVEVVYGPADSIGEGLNASVIGTMNGTRCVDVLRSDLQARHPVAGVTGGEGYIPGSQFVATDRWTYGGGLVGSPNPIGGLGRKAQFLTSAGHTMSITVPCTGLDIIWMGSSTTDVFSYAIDGGSATNVDTTIANLTGGNVTQIRGLSQGDHTLLIARVSGTSVIEGAMVYNEDEACGIHVRECAHGSYYTADYVGLSTTQGLEWIHSMDPGTVEPDLVIIALVTNDYYFGLLPATMQANLTTLVANIRARLQTSPSFVFVVPPKRADVTAPTYPWGEYTAAVYAAAKADPLRSVAVCDLDPRFWLSSISAPWANPPGWIHATDKVHPLDAGHALWAHAIADYLEPSR